MQNFQDNFETCKWSFISAFSICMTVPLRTVFKHYLSSASKYIPLYNSNYPCSIYLFKFFNFVLNLIFFFFLIPKNIFSSFAFILEVNPWSQLCQVWFTISLITVKMTSHDSTWLCDLLVIWLCEWWLLSYNLINCISHISCWYEAISLLICHVNLSQVTIWSKSHLTLWLVASYLKPLIYQV